MSHYHIIKNTGDFSLIITGEGGVSVRLKPDEMVLLQQELPPSLQRQYEAGNIDFWTVDYPEESEPVDWMKEGF